jgi:hypothetical protein
MLDWSTITLSGACSALLTALILGFWKPWLGAYGGEKGKNLARKEDLDAILAEVRAVTITQKEIEAKLTGDAWTRQMLWNQKRDAYIALFNAKEGLANSFGSLKGAIGGLNKAPESEKSKPVSYLRESLTTPVGAQHAFASAYSLAVLFTNEECLAQIAKYVTGKTKTQDIYSEEWADTEFQNILVNLSGLPTIAKKDLGIT